MINLRRLPNQERGEVTELFLRRHWLEQLVVLAYFVALSAIPVALGLVYHLSGFPLPEHPFWVGLIIVLLSIYGLCVVLIVMTMYTDFYLDTWIVTNERIIDVNHDGLFSRTVSELHLTQIEDVTSETHGFLATIFTYGDVHVQTAGARTRFHFDNVDDPDEVKRKVLRLVRECKERHGTLSDLDED